jgi:archaeal type IV pilus assembly protein PilA
MASRLSQDQDAVSPVIGVILMVAITVVLAAVVFVLVSHLGSGVEMPPAVGMQTSDEGQSFLVVQADSGLDWSDFTAAPCTTIPTGPFLAGQTVSGCGGSVHLVHKPSNTVLYAYP